MAYLQIDLGPSGWVVAVAALIVIGLRALERHATALAATRTQRALERALDGPTEE